jgi:ribosomal-protein-alanine N-acetyltransferase
VKGVVSVREFALDDLEAAGRFCDAARALDPAIEPFAQRLGVIATGSRALLDLWRVAADEEGALCGIAFAAVRSEQPPLYDFYAAVHPSLRRQGLGRALAGPAAASGAGLRARVRDDCAPGRGFLRALGFAEAGAQLSLHWSGQLPWQPPMPALRIRPAREADKAALERLSRAAWTDAPDTRPDEIAQLFADEDRLVLVAESEGRPLGYLAGVKLGRTLGIEEVAVSPDFRRMGVGRALVAHALAREQAAVLSVSEANLPARALYRSLGFALGSRRIVMELRPG